VVGGGGGLGGGGGGGGAPPPPPTAASPQRFGVAGAVAFPVGTVSTQRRHSLVSVGRIQ
jgi:hypothetical protein